MAVSQVSASERLLRAKSVYGEDASTGLSKTQCYRLIQRGEFPAPLKIGARAVAWRASEVQAWIDARPSKGGIHD
ncbi:AlpA family phage regulatory protein [Paraburkholderia sediminicola]|uniref:helix-turn-helix transcriptional regulator n=1 Tax=Paraburkholderia sediminicola TaxID=458836 RepID=UPI0038B8FEAB